MKQREEKPADPLPSDPPPGDRVKRPLPNRKGGAPRGNVNGARDPSFTLAMREARKAARKGRRKRHGSHLDAARATVAECGLEDSPLGERIAQRLAQVEHEIDELGRVVERIGRVKRNGELCPPYEKRLTLIREDRAELRALVDKLAEVLAAQPSVETEIIYTIKSADGSDVSLSVIAPPELASEDVSDRTAQSAAGTGPKVRPSADPLASTPALNGAKAVKSEPHEAGLPADEHSRSAIRSWARGDDLGD